MKQLENVQDTQKKNNCIKCEKLMHIKIELQEIINHHAYSVSNEIFQNQTIEVLKSIIERKLS